MLYINLGLYSDGQKKTLGLSISLALMRRPKSTQRLPPVVLKIMLLNCLEAVR